MTMTLNLALSFKNNFIFFCGCEDTNFSRDILSICKWNKKDGVF